MYVYVDVHVHVDVSGVVPLGIVRFLNFMLDALRTSGHICDSIIVH